MLSPMMTVFVLAVLWLIVVVPMILRRRDEKRRDRTVDGFGRAMRALGRRSDTDREDVYVPAERQREREHARRSQVRRDEARRAQARRAAVTAARRPVPSAQEALMLPVDRSEMSAARRQMMRRRRRSLAVLVGGTALFALAGVVLGGMLWLAAAGFGVGLAGYLYFLRSQALRDRARRANRLQRTSARRATTGYDATATEQIARFTEPPASVVRIDDDDIELHNLDTIDLTGIYDEELSAPAAQRRAS